MILHLQLENLRFDYLFNPRINVGLILIVRILVERNEKSLWIGRYPDTQLLKLLFSESNKV